MAPGKPAAEGRAAQDDSDYAAGDLEYEAPGQQPVQRVVCVEAEEKVRVVQPLIGEWMPELPKRKRVRKGGDDGDGSHHRKAQKDATHQARPAPRDQQYQSTECRGSCDVHQVGGETPERLRVRNFTAGRALTDQLTDSRPRHDGRECNADSGHPAECRMGGMRGKVSRPGVSHDCKAPGSRG